MLYNFPNINYTGKVFNVTLTSLIDEPQIVIAIGFDPDVENRTFFMREMFLDAKAKGVSWKLPSPLTSKTVHVLLFNINESADAKTNLFKVDKITASSIAPIPKFADAKKQEFVDFILPICYHYENLKLDAWYYSKNKNFSIYNRSIIPNNDTPARILKNGEHHIEISDKVFYGYPIPRKVLILCHEYCHYYENYNPDNESEADINALKKIYLPLHFPVIEGVYAFTKILRDDYEGRMRAKKIIDYLHWYNEGLLNIFKNHDDYKEQYINTFVNRGINY